MIEMDVQRGERQLVLIVKGACQALGKLPRGVVIDIDERRHAIALAVGVLRGLPDAGAGEIADRLRSVLVAARGDDGVELGHQLIVEGDRHSLHRENLRILAAACNL